jgi:dienelactone hydrolase
MECDSPGLIAERLLAMKAVLVGRPLWFVLSRMRTVAVLGLASLLAASLVLAQNFAPPPSKSPKKAVLAAIDAKIAKLSQALTSLRKQKVRDPWLAEVDIYLKAAQWIREEDEFYQKESADWTLEALDRGLLRARQLAGGESPWVGSKGHAVIRAYRSRVDGSVQPYAVTFPAAYGEDREKKWRVDVVLHGRDPSLTEVKFLHQFNGDQDAPKDQAFVQINILGRGNNAYRWAGETDVLEALNAFIGVERMLGRHQLLDPHRIVLRGFSMGGAGTWHLGLHYPSRWRVLGPGAGFTTTKGYVKDLGKLTPAQEACLHIYDAVDYAENAFDVPIVAYAGSKDPQLQAAKNIESRLKALGISDRMTLLEAPGLDHEFPATWQAKAQKDYSRLLRKNYEEYPTRVHFVTYTLRYPSCSWVEILGLGRHYEQALVHAEKTETGYTVKTANVRSLHLTLAEDAPERLVLSVDKQAVPARVWLGQGEITRNVYLQRRGDRWVSVRPQKLLNDRIRRPQKLTGLQGPIDDAFMEPFLCVYGTGEHPWHAATRKYADANLKRFAKEWSKYMRGELPVKDDVDVNDDDIANKNLILFGDPASNSLIADVVDDLPLRWTRETITLAGKEYDAADHVPVLIYPNPLNAQRYVVLNSGHTFHAAEFERTNALLYPRLGDYAVLKLAPTEKDPAKTTVAVSGLFNDFWQFGKK